MKKEFNNVQEALEDLWTKTLTNAHSDMLISFGKMDENGQIDTLVINNHMTKIINIHKQQINPDHYLYGFRYENDVVIDHYNERILAYQEAQKQIALTEDHSKIWFEQWRDDLTAALGRISERFDE